MNKLDLEVLLSFTKQIIAAGGKNVKGENMTVKRMIDGQIVYLHKIYKGDLKLDEVPFKDYHTVAFLHGHRPKLFFDIDNPRLEIYKLYKTMIEGIIKDKELEEKLFGSKVWIEQNMCDFLGANSHKDITITKGKYAGNLIISVDGEEQVDLTVPTNYVDA